METRGCALPLNLLIRHLLAGESYSAEVSQAVRRELYGYFDELVFTRLDLATRRLVMELAPCRAVSQRRPLSRLRRQLPLRRGAMGRAQSLPCAKGGVAAKP